MAKVDSSSPYPHFTRASTLAGVGARTRIELKHLL